MFCPTKKVDSVKFLIAIIPSLNGIFIFGSIDYWQSPTFSICRIFIPRCSHAFAICMTLGECERGNPN